MKNIGHTKNREKTLKVQTLNLTYFNFVGTITVFKVDYPPIPISFEITSEINNGFSINKKFLAYNFLLIKSKIVYA